MPEAETLSLHHCKLQSDQSEINSLTFPGRLSGARKWISIRVAHSPGKLFSAQEVRSFLVLSFPIIFPLW